MNFRCVLILTGPTGVGKTDISLGLADYFPIEIINCDMGQFYEPLAIGTAKPLWKQEKIPHHLFDIITKPQDICVITYRTLLKKKIDEIWSRGALPVIVGGSGFYIHSLFFPPHTVKENTYLHDWSQYTTEELWEQLYEVDSERALKLHKNDRYRIERGLDIWKSTGKLPSTLQPTFDPICPALVVCLTRVREELCKRINSRTITMLNSGWIEEVEHLSSEWQQFLNEKKLIGYPEIIDYLYKKDKHLSDLIEIIQKKTCAYAKRQMTYWRRFKKMLNHYSLVYKQDRVCRAKSKFYQQTHFPLYLPS